MKKWMAVLMVLAFARISQGQGIIDKWDFNVPDGAMNTALSTSETGAGGSDWKADGNASIVSGEAVFGRNDAGNYFDSPPISDTAWVGATGAGVVEMEFDVVSVDWSLTAAANTNAYGAFGVRGSGGDMLVRLYRESRDNVTNATGVAGVTNIYANADHVLLQFQHPTLDGDGGWKDIVAYPGSGTQLANLHIRVSMDLANSTVDMFYTEDGGSEINGYSGTLDPNWAITSWRAAFFMNKDTQSIAWQSGDTVKFDNIVYTEIDPPTPPPALAVIDYWGYEGLTNGAGQSQAASAGFVGGVTFSDATPASITNLVDGAITNGALRLTSNELENESMFRTASPSLYGGNSTGVYEVVMDILSVDFTETSTVGANGTFGFEVRDASNNAMGLHLLYHGGNDEIRLEFEDASGTTILKAIPGHVASNIQLRFLMDLDQAGASGSAQAFYTYNGIEIGKYDGTVHAGYDFTQYRLRAQPINGGNGWKIGDVSLVDSLKIEKVASLGTPPVYFDIVDYQMNDGSGTLLNALAQDGTDAGQFQGTDSFIATDGIGSLVFNPVTEGVTRKHFLGTTFTEGLNRLEFAFADWNLDATEDGSFVKFALVDDSGTNQVQFGIDVNTNNATVRFRASANNGGDAGQDISYGGYIGTTGVVLRIDVNLDGGTYSASWKFDNGDVFNSVVGGGSLGLMDNISEIRLAVTDTGWDAADYVNVDYLTFSTTSDEAPWTPESRYAAWLDTYLGLGSSTNLLDNMDGDVVDNLSEYALGGDPTDSADIGHVPGIAMTEEGGTNYLEYVHVELDDNATGNRGLDYILKVGTNLIITDWTTAGIEFVGQGAGPDGFNSVTNRVQTDGDQKFLRLQIQFTP